VLRPIPESVNDAPILVLLLVVTVAGCATLAVLATPPPIFRGDAAKAAMVIGC